MHVDVLDRMRTLGLHSIEELQARMDERPQDFTHRELMEVAELTLVKGAGAGSGVQKGTVVAPVNLQIAFVGPGPVVESKVAPQVIEVEK